MQKFREPQGYYEVPWTAFHFFSEQHIMTYLTYGGLKIEGWLYNMKLCTFFLKRDTSLKWRTHMWDNYYHAQIKCLFTVNKRIIRVGTITLFCWPRFCLVLWCYQTVDICWWHKYFTLSFFTYPESQLPVINWSFFVLSLLDLPPTGSTFPNSIYGGIFKTPTFSHLLKKLLIVLFPRDISHI